MKSIWLAPGVVLLLIGCSRQDEDFAKRKAQQAGQELRHDAQKASEQLKEGAQELKRTAGPKLDKAGRELKEDAHRASEKLKEKSDQLRRERSADDPPRKDQ
jgi:hypothetical protein